MTDETLDSLGRTIAGALPGAVGGYTLSRGELTLSANAADIVRVMRFLRDDPFAFYAFIDVTAVDWPQRERRFDDHQDAPQPAVWAPGAGSPTRLFQA